MTGQPSRRFVSQFVAAYPGRTAQIVGALALAALIDGFGFLTLLPVIETAISSTGATDQTSPVTQAFASALSTMGIPASLPVLLGLIVLAFALKGLVYFLAMRAVGYAVAHVSHDLRAALMSALIRASWSHFVRQSTGRIANAISSEAQRASFGYLSFCTALAEALQILVYAALIVAISWQAAVAAPVAAFAAVLLFQPLLSASRRAGNVSTLHMQNLVDRLAELLPGMKAFKAMGLERDGWPMMIREALAYRDAQRRGVALRETLNAAHEPLAAVLLALALYAGLTYGALSLPMLLMLAALFQRIMTRARLLQGEVQNMLSHESAFHSIEALTRAAEAAREPASTGRPQVRLTQAIRLEDVRVSHGDHEVLRGVDLTLEAGSFTALAGPTGAGKTTLIDVVVGLTPPSEGRVLIDEKPIDTIDLQSWRQRIGYLPQEPLLFHDTLRRNVSLETGASETEIVEALRLAEAWDFIAKRREGLDYVVGERGSGLSGGQRQRICLARALLRQPDLLVLDEATSGLDEATETRVCQTLRRLAGRMTILAVSHQPAIRGVADRTVYLRDGAVRQIEERSAVV